MSGPPIVLETRGTNPQQGLCVHDPKQLQATNISSSVTFNGVRGNVDGASMNIIFDHPDTFSSIPPAQTDRGTTSFIRDMPIELVAEILCFLDLSTMVKCRTVCSAFRDLIDSSPYLCFMTELAIAGQENGSDCYPLTARRNMLAQYQQRWTDLDWATEMRLEVMGGNQWELYGNVLAQDTPDRSTIHFKQLPSQSRNIQERDWAVGVKGIRMRDFKMDPAQDLLVIVEEPLGQGAHNHTIFLRTLSTGEPHPLAVNSGVLIHQQQRRAEIDPCYLILTCGDTLGVVFGSRGFEETEIVLWNWKTGAVLVNIVREVITAMTFLSERHIIIGVLRMAPGTLFAPEARLVAVDFIAESPDRRGLDDVENAFVFCFPPLAEAVDILDVTVFSDPAPLWKPHSDLSVPFFTAQHDRLYAINILVRPDGNDVRTVQLFALDSSFLSLMEKVSDGGGKRFEWALWGPNGTRMIVPEFPDSGWFTRYVHGRRYVSTRASPMEPAHFVHVYDFNQLALRRSKLHESNAAHSPNADVAVVGAMDDKAKGEKIQPYLNVTAPTKFTGGIFRDEVETRLGYRVKCWDIPERPAILSVMCSEDGIVLVRGGDMIEEYHILSV